MTGMRCFRTDLGQESNRAPAPVRSVRPPLLALRDAVRPSGAAAILDPVSMTVAAGEVVGVVASDAARMSALFDLITGEAATARGSILFDGIDVSAAGPPERAGQGIVRAGPALRAFARMSVLENVLLDAVSGRGANGDAFALGRALLCRTGLAGLADVRAGSLAPADRKRLELARALATRPRLLLIDGLAADPNAAETGLLVALVREVRAEGIAVIWAEPSVDALAHAVDRLVVLDRGRIVADGPAETVLDDPAIRRPHAASPVAAAAAPG